MRSMKASEFKAKCLAILDEVHETGEPVMILKRGRPVAQLVSPTRGISVNPQDELRGSVTILGDIMEPVLESTLWDAERGKLL
jgi:prevent-host-death family protein